MKVFLDNITKWDVFYFLLYLGLSINGFVSGHTMSGMFWSSLFVWRLSDKITEHFHLEEKKELADTIVRIMVSNLDGKLTKEELEEYEEDVKSDIEYYKEQENGELF